MNETNHSTHRCRICDADASFQNERCRTVYGGKRSHKFWQCTKCDAVYLYPSLSAQEEKKFYKDEFSKFMSARSGNDTDWSNAKSHIVTNQDQVNRRWPFLRPHIKSGMDLLEIGCSSGFMMNKFRDNGLNCTGIEPSGEFLKYLNSTGFPAFSSLEELKKNSKKTFDLIVHFFVLEHISDPYSFFRETYDLLRPGGKILAEIPCVNDPLTSIFEIPAFENFYWSIAHHYYYSPKSLSFVLDKLDFSYEIIPEQRYDLSNHIVWMTEGKPGGQGRFNHVFSKELISKYSADLKKQWLCDSMYLVIYKNQPK